MLNQDSFDTSSTKLTTHTMKNKENCPTNIGSKQQIKAKSTYNF